MCSLGLPHNDHFFYLIGTVSIDLDLALQCKAVLSKSLNIELILIEFIIQMLFIVQWIE